MTNQLTNLDSIFRFAADKYGSSIAIDDGECCISYSDLDACVDQLAFGAITIKMGWGRCMIINHGDGIFP